MPTTTVSTRLPKAEAKELEALAKQLGLERSALLKQIIRRGQSDILFERACEAYRRGEVSLSRAAEIAKIGLGDMLARMPETGLELNYSLDDLAKDLAHARRR
jgi:predicted HTH domain antitoxin